MRKPDNTPKGVEMRKLGKAWIDRIEAAGKAEKDWQDDAQDAQDAYTGYTTDKKDGKISKSANPYDFNILHANVETIVPAVINSPPVPDIRRRFGEADPAAKTLAQVTERAIQVQIDDSRLQEELERAAQDAFLAGRGITRLRFRSDITGEPTDDAIEDAAEAADPGRRDRDAGGGLYEPGADGFSDDPSGAFDPSAPGSMEAQQSALNGQDYYGAGGQTDNAGQPAERVENERITFEAVPWIDYRHGPAKRWDERQWDAFRFCIPHDELDGGFFDKGLIGDQLSAEESSERAKQTGADKEVSGWEVWDKPKRRVLFIDDDGVILKIVPDPLGLSGFFCIPTPMQPIEVNGRLTPVNPFAVYKSLAEKLDRAVRRKDRLIEGMKAKGWYASSAKDMASIIDKEDNEWVPFEDLEAVAAAGGLEKAILFWPVEKFIQVIQQLDVAIGTYKQWIYEITGISDIIRGASNASETATAQNIKSQWGSLRIQKMQRMMERTARELFVMMSEIIPTKFTMQALEEMTGIPIVPQPNDPPEVVEQKLAVIELMKRPLARFYRIDVESDSTIRADLTRQKQELSQFLSAASSYFGAVGPLVKEGTMPADAAAEIFAASARMFNLGRSVEDTVEGMIQKAKEMANQPPKPDPKQQEAEQKQQMEAEKAQAVNAKMMADAEARQQETAARQQEAQIRMAEAARKAEADGVAAQHQAVINQLEIELKQLAILEKREAIAAGQGKPTEANKPPSESIAFKDLPPEGQAQMAAHAGIVLTPEQIAGHQAQQDAKKAAEAAAKAQKPMQEIV